jgi:hypothetical protein
MDIITGGWRSNVGIFWRTVNIFAKLNNFLRPHGI